MFTGVNSLVGQLDPRKVRPAPRLPTVVSFPEPAELYHVKPTPWGKENIPRFEKLRLKLLYPNTKDEEFGLDILEIMNIDLFPASDLEDFLDRDNATAQSCIVPKSWNTEPTKDQEKATILDKHKIQSTKQHNGRDWPTRKDYFVRVSELLVQNEHALRGHARVPLQDGSNPPKISHTRPFYEQIDLLMQYWDTSLDEYFTSDESESEDEPESLIQKENEPRKRAKMTVNPIMSPEVACPTESSQTQGADISLPPEIEEGELAARSKRVRNEKLAKGAELPGGTYKGWRIDSGMYMPPKIRDETVKTLINLVTWNFGAQVDRTPQASYLQPRLRIGKSLITAGLTRRVWRDPVTRQEMRTGIVNGPVLGYSVRHVTGFRDNKFAASVDVLKEVGALLLIAQERYREGKEEKIAGEEAWWIHKPRWGGLPFEVPGEFKPTTGLVNPKTSSSSTLSSGADQEKEDLSSLIRMTMKGFKSSSMNGGGPQMTNKERAISIYKEEKIDPMSSAQWNKKAIYKRIGGLSKNKATDEVFLVSSINHHLRIARLVVSDAYLDVMEDEKIPADVENLSKDWSRPTVYRTTWYDLLDPNQRAEAFRALWSIMTYLSISDYSNHARTRPE